MPSTSSKSAKIIATAIGRRKTATASVRLISGTGQVTVNSKSLNAYFPDLQSQALILEPFTTVSATKYDASIKVSGGGQAGQASAAVLAISRALVEAKSAHKPLLKSKDLLTRDPRERQRRNVGMGGKSRRRKQSPKR
jgi:small subunit ribosomal protein S9